jgi:dihydroorotate dehydrogenase (NAD+) catalytic subunit
MGGITCAQDVVEFLACGAQHVALGTVLFSDPDASKRIREELSVVQLDDPRLSEMLLEFRANAVA